MKTKVFNLIILDESGSMTSIAPATIAGCNDTLAAIRSFQEKFGDTQDQYVSIFAFQKGGYVNSRYIVKNTPANEVTNITRKDYMPMGGTPLLDAVGSTLADLKAIVATHENAIANVTIITDGYENASTDYTFGQVVEMIDGLKKMGWTFSFIGTNMDVDWAADQFNIKNRMSFEYDNDGTKTMFEREMKARERWNDKVRCFFGNCKDVRSFRMKLSETEEDYFAEDDNE